MNKFYLYFGFIGSLTYVFWGYVVTLLYNNLVVDSFFHRLTIAAPFLLLMIYNQFSKKFKEEYIVYVGIFLITSDYCYLITLNNNITHATGLYVVLTASLSVIKKRWFLWLYSGAFTAYCLFSIMFFDYTILEKSVKANMLTLILLMTFFGIWRIKNEEQLDIEYKNNLEKSKKLEELNNIAAQAAHDIRSPITALKSFISSSSELDPKKLKIVINAEKRINEISDYLVGEYRKNIFDGKKENAKDIFENLSVSELVEGIINEKLLLQSEYKKFEITLNGKSDFLIEDINFQIDLKRIISNIISNSIEAFLDSNGKITVILSENSEYFIVSIEDNGKGIHPEHIDKVFEKGSSFGKIKGTGLGLSHAKETVQKYDGEIELTSKVNIGTKVLLKFKKS